MTPTLLICASLLIVAGVILLVCACIDLDRMGVEMIDSDSPRHSDGDLVTFHTFSMRWKFGDPAPEMVPVDSWVLRANAGKHEWVRVQIDPADAIHR